MKSPLKTPIHQVEYNQVSPKIQDNLGDDLPLGLFGQYGAHSLTSASVSWCRWEKHLAFFFGYE